MEQHDPPCDSNPQGLVVPPRWRRIGLDASKGIHIPSVEVTFMNTIERCRCCYGLIGHAQTFEINFHVLRLLPVRVDIHTGSNIAIHVGARVIIHSHFQRAQTNRIQEVRRYAGFEMFSLECFCWDFFFGRLLQCL